MQLEGTGLPEAARTVVGRLAHWGKCKRNLGSVLGISEQLTGKVGNTVTLLLARPRPGGKHHLGTFQRLEMMPEISQAGPLLFPFPPQIPASCLYTAAFEPNKSGATMEAVAKFLDR